METGCLEKGLLCSGFRLAVPENLFACEQHFFIISRDIKYGVDSRDTKYGTRQAIGKQILTGLVWMAFLYI